MSTVRSSSILLAGLLACAFVAALRADSTSRPQDRDPTFTLDDDDDFEPPGGSGGLGGDEGEAISAGSLDLEWDFEADPGTRWEAVKQTLQRMFLGYVNGDLSAFMGGFSASMEQDVSIFRNAAMGDFQRETSINVDIQIVEYRVTFDQICTRFLWNRNAVDQATGQVGVQTGETYSCFNRHDDFRISLMTGQVPFGAGDPQLQTQIKAGQPNDPLGNPLVPPMVSMGPFTVPIVLDDQFGGPGNVVAIDLDDPGYSRRILAAGSPPWGGAMANEDLFIGSELSGGDGIFVQAHGVNGVTIEPCTAVPKPSFTTIRNVPAGGALIAALWDSFGGGFINPVFGVTQPGGEKSLVEFQNPVKVGNNLTADIVFLQQTTGNPVVADGTVDCFFDT